MTCLNLGFLLKLVTELTPLEHAFDCNQLLNTNHTQGHNFKKKEDYKSLDTNHA